MCVRIKNVVLPFPGIHDLDLGRVEICNVAYRELQAVDKRRRGNQTIGHSEMTQVSSRMFTA